jgi:hypothetical protein
LEVFFISSLVCLHQGSIEGSGWNYFFQFYGLSVPRFSRGKGLELFFYSSMVCLSQGSLQWEVVGTILFSFMVSLSQEGSREMWLELIFISYLIVILIRSLVCLEEGRGPMAGTLLHDSSDLSSQSSEEGRRTIAGTLPHHSLDLSAQSSEEGILILKA